MADAFLPVRKLSGITPSERYLERVCERNFLSLWSYPRPFRDQGNKIHKEICDLLVVMGDDILIFSDKHCVLEPKKSLAIDWQRWFRAPPCRRARNRPGVQNDGCGSTRIEYSSMPSARVACRCGCRRPMSLGTTSS